jgi:hypothetical protein
MLVALRLASIDFILFDTVQLVWIRAAPVVVNHIPLSKKESRCCAARLVLFICTDAIWRVTCLYPTKFPYLHRLAGNSGLVLYILWTTAHVSLAKADFNSKDLN